MGFRTFFLLATIFVSGFVVPSAANSFWDNIWRWPVVRTERDPIRGTWKQTDVDISEGTVAQLELSITGGTAPYHVIFLKEGNFFMRVTTSGRNLAILETTEPGNYSVKHIWDQKHFPGQVPGSHKYDPSEIDDSIENTFPPDICCVQVQLRSRPTFSFKQNTSEHCDRPVAMIVDGVPPFRITYKDLSKNDERYITAKEAGEVMIPIRNAASYQIQVYDKFKVAAAVPHIIRLHELPKAAMFVRGNGRVCSDEKVHLELNLTHGSPPWSFVINYESPKGARKSLNFDGIPTRHFAFGADKSGEYRLVSVRDSNCHDVHMVPASVEILPKVFVDFSQTHHAACEGTMTDLKISVAGKAPWYVMLEKDGEEFTRELIQNATCAEGVCEATTRVVLGGSYRIGETTDDNWCRSEGRTVATVERWALPNITISTENICASRSLSVTLSGMPPFSIGYTIYTKSGVSTKGTKVLCADFPKGLFVEAAECLWDLPLDSSSGEYLVDSIRDGRGCESFTSVIHKTGFMVHHAVSAEFVGRVSVVCEGQTVEISAQLTHPYETEWEAEFEYVPAAKDGAASREWVSATSDKAIHRASRAGTYRLVGVRDSRCDVGTVVGNKELQLQTLVPPTVTVSSIDRTDDCVGALVHLAFTGVPPWKATLGSVNQKSWSLDVVSDNSNHTVKVPGSGTYFARKISDGHHCSGVALGQAKIDVRPPAGAVWDLKKPRVEFCDGGQTKIAIKFSGTPPFSFSVLRDGNLFLHKESVPEKVVSLTIADEGKYTMGTLMDAEGCAGILDHRTIDVKKRKLPSILSISDTRVCEGSVVKLQLSGQAPFVLNLADSQSTESSQISVVSNSNELNLVLGGTDAHVTQPGNYRVTQIRDNFCTGTSTFSISMLPLPNLEISLATAADLAFGEQTTMFASLKRGSPPWTAEIGPSPVEEEGQPPFVVNSRETEVVLGNRPGHRSWRVLWVQDESGCNATEAQLAEFARVPPKDTYVVDLTGTDTAAVPDASSAEVEVYEEGQESGEVEGDGGSVLEGTEAEGEVLSEGTEVEGDGEEVLVLTEGEAEVVAEAQTEEES